MNAWRVVELLGVIAEESRYGIVAMLVQAGEDGLLQNRVLSRSGLPLPRLKRHLAKLVKVGLVRRNHRRKGVVWKIDERQIGELVETLTIKLQPLQLKNPGQVIAIEATKSFRSLTSKLASLAQCQTRATRAKRRRPIGHTVPAERRLPARLIEAIERETRDDCVSRSIGSTPEPGPEPAATSQSALPAPGHLTPNGSPVRRRRHPVRLSDAIADLSG
jgi:DNA-binding transcriptional ArsR family regulator